MEEEKTTTPEEETPEEEKKPDLFAETIKTLKQQNDELKLALNDLKKQYGDLEIAFNTLLDAPAPKPANQGPDPDFIKKCRL